MTSDNDVTNDDGDTGGEMSQEIVGRFVTRLASERRHRNS